MGAVEAVLLGTAQDAGLPQVGCRCGRCQAARKDKSLQRLPVSLAIVDHGAGAYWLIDATPALREQLDFLSLYFPDYSLQGVLLTHAHMGHYTGLIQFGKESWNVRGFPLYGSARMRRFLQGNEPWSTLLKENVEFVEVMDGDVFRLSDQILIEPALVPHRSEFSDTFGFWVLAGSAKLFYCPDIDGWSEFSLEDILSRATIAMLDATFFKAEEVPGRDIASIPHPIISEILPCFKGFDCETWLIHMNHTNPLHDNEDAQALATGAGVGVASQWQRWVLE